MSEESRALNKKFIEEALRSTGRGGVEELLKWMDENGYFCDPASTVYHNNYPGGLADHCISVLKVMIKLNQALGLGIDDKTLIITALLHDLDKVGVYEIYGKNIKDEDGKWRTYNGYKFGKGNRSVSHGTGSLLIASQFIKLTEEESVAIINHMGLWGDNVETRSLTTGYAKYPVSEILSMADEFSTVQLELTYDIKEIPWV